MRAVAIDGPSAAGKSTISKQLALKLGFLYIDTGSLYRTVGLHVMNKIGGYTDKAAVIGCLADCHIEMKIEDGKQIIRLDGTNVGESIRTPEISMAASAVSAIPEVRAFLLDFQKSVAAKQSVVMDGRDIGTVVLPAAMVKIFLTASAEARSKRRFLELSAKGHEVIYETVYNELVERDKNDSSRDIAPLKPAEGATIVDTTDMTIDEVVDRLYEISAAKLANY